MPQAQLNFVIVCNEAVVSEQTQNLYLLGIFDRVGVKGEKRLPFIHPRFCVVTSVEGEVGKYEEVIIVKHVDSNKELFSRKKADMEIKPGGQKATHIINLWNIPFEKDGKYIVEVELNGQLQDLKASFIVE